MTIRIITLYVMITSCSSNEQKDFNYVDKFNNGQFKTLGNLKNGQKVDDWIFFSKNGDTTKIVNYLNDTITSLKKFKNNKLYYYEERKNGKKNGKTISYITVPTQISNLDTLESRLKVVETYKNGLLHGNSIEYFDEGINNKIHRISYYENGLQTGEYRQYYKNGNLGLYSKDINTQVYTHYDTSGMPTIDFRLNGLEYDTLKIYPN